MAVVKLKNFWKGTLAPQFYCVQVVNTIRNLGWHGYKSRGNRYLGRITVPDFPGICDVNAMPQMATIALPAWEGRIYYRSVTLVGFVADGSFRIEDQEEEESEKLPCHVLRNDILPPNYTGSLVLYSGSASTEKGSERLVTERTSVYKDTSAFGDTESGLEGPQNGEELADHFELCPEAGADNSHTFKEQGITCFETLLPSTSTGRGPVLLVASGSIVRAYDFEHLKKAVMQFDAGSEVLCLSAEASGNRFVCGTRDGLLIVVGLGGPRKKEKFEVVIRICHNMSRQLGIAHEESAKQRTAVLCCATYVDLECLTSSNGEEHGNENGKKEVKREADREPFTFISGGEDGKLRTWNSRGECLQVGSGCPEQRNVHPPHRFSPSIHPL